MKALWLLLLLPLLSFAPDTARPNCRSDIQGVTYCVADGGATYLIIIDLSDPYLRVQTVMANDVFDIRPLEAEREKVFDMARRYRTDGVIAAINGDYFGRRRGPEGPTVVQGQRLDTRLTIALNPSEYRRTTLALSRSGQAAVTQLNPIGSLAPYRDPLFNAVSGGPIILYKGVVLPEALSCLFDGIPMGSCRRDRQTAAGVDKTGRMLYLLASEQRSTSRMAELLRDYGAFNALKLDGGGSTQLWYRGRTLVDSDVVANASVNLSRGRAAPCGEVDRAPAGAVDRRRYTGFRRGAAAQPRPSRLDDRSLLRLAPARR
jgi:hypothetical protein